MTDECNGDGAVLQHGSGAVLMVKRSVSSDTLTLQRSNQRRK